MLRYLIEDLSDLTHSDLAAQQARVDARTSHEERYLEAKNLFGRKTPKRAFDEVRASLALHSPQGEACYYCERDRYRDIEHIWPKRHYPEKCFVWKNYVYACTICNQDAKRDKFAIFDSDDNVVVFDKSLQFNQPIPQGQPVLIDIRSEDPLDYLQLDLQTGLFVSIGSSIRDQKRGEFTRDLFDLDNDALTRIRRQAVAHFTDYITRYISAKNEGRLDDANRLLTEIKELPHPTVLVELRRQAASLPKLAALLEHLPPEIGKRP